MTPLEALEACFTYVSGTTRNGPHGIPGEVVQRICRSDEYKEALQNLKSEDIRDVRVDKYV